MIGTTVSRYKVLAKLGSGGMGVVYEAQDLELGRRVALKFLPEATAQDTATLERFKREARAASALNHPHICTVYDVGTHEGRPFLVMERLSGHTLTRAIAGHELSIEQVIDLGIQIADALDAAHRVGIVHRDLKPGNLFVNERGAVKVLDFGLAKMSASEPHLPVPTDAPTLGGEILTEEGKTLGTVAYMSPEQARGDPVDARSDLFSFGVVLYEMASGHLPFGANSTAEFFAAILTSQPSPPSRWKEGIPAPLEAIVMKALQRDPDLRYQTAAELRDDLLRLRAGASASPGPATLPGWGTGSDRRTSRSESRVPAPAPGRRLWLGVSAAALVVVAILALVTWRLLGTPAKASPGLSVLIGDTVNRTGDATFDDTLTELLTTAIHQSRFLAVFPRTRAAFVLRLMQRDPATPIDDTVGLEICQREGLGALVSASISHLGTAHLLLVRVTDPNGRELASARETFDNPADAPARIDAAVKSLRAGVGESAASIRATSLPLAEVSSASLEAVKFFTRGQQRQRAGDPAQALELFERALEIDPSFAMAEDAVGLVYTNIQDLARAEEHFSKAVALSNKVAAAEQHKILADYAMLRRDYDAACGHLVAVTELRSLDPVSFMALGICRAFQLDFAGAVAETERGLKMQAYPLGRANLARWQLGAGNAAAALATADALRREQPTNLQAQFVAARAELALGRLDDARRTYELMSANGGDMEAEGRLGLADLELGTGRLAHAREELEAAWQAANRRNNVLAVARATAAAAELALATGRYDEFAAAVARLQGARHPVALYLRARSFARAGRAVEARAGLAELAAATSDTSPDQALRALVRAELALAENDTTAAMKEADAAWGYEPSVLARETQARAYAAAGRSADAIRFYEDVLSRQTQRLDSYDAPGFHRTMEAKHRLAVLLDDAGEHARARPYLEALLSAWRGADAGLPASADVQRRLAQQP